MTIQRFRIGPRLSEMAICNNTIYLAGQVADDPSQDVANQTKQVLDKIDKLLAEAGSDKTRILSATIYIAAMTDFPEVNTVWDEWVVQGHTPPRATVEAKLAKPAYKVELQIVAAR